jgi:hypothetical protein
MRPATSVPFRQAGGTRRILAFIRVTLGAQGVVPSKGIHIVAAAKKQRTKIHIVRGDFVADVVTNTRSQPPVHHWVVQRKGSSDILGLGQEATFEDAEKVAASFLDDLAPPKEKKA